MEPPKISSTKSISIKQEPKASSSLPSGSNNGKVLAAEKIKKEAEKRPADKVRFTFSSAYERITHSHRQKEWHVSTSSSSGYGPVTTTP